MGPLFLHYLIRNCFVKRTKNMMAKNKVIKIKETLPSSKIQNILACTLGPQMGWIEEEKNR
jgi:hypothetical protein